MSFWNTNTSSSSPARSPSRVAAVTLGFIAVLYLAWTGAWLLLPVVESRLGWPSTADERTLYWITMRVLLWIVPSLFVFRYAGIRVGDAMRGDGARPAIVWGGGAGLLIGAEAVLRKWLLAQPYSLSPSWTLLSVVVIAPFVEEFVFRGAVLGGLMHRYSFAVANVIASLLFVGAHVPGWYFSGVIAHSLNNFFSVL